MAWEAKPKRSLNPKTGYTPSPIGHSDTQLTRKLLFQNCWKTTIYPQPIQRTFKLWREASTERTPTKSKVGPPNPFTHASIQRRDHSKLALHRGESRTLTLLLPYERRWSNSNRFVLEESLGNFVVSKIPRRHWKALGVRRTPHSNWSQVWHVKYWVGFTLPQAPNGILRLSPEYGKEEI